jgi:RimJ/RimL family protein N-acetyltransferase
VLSPRYPIDTERLTLRPHTKDDFDDVYAFQSRPEVARYLYWDARTPDEVRDALEEKVGESVLTDDGQRLSLAVVWRETGQVVGQVSLKWLSREHRQGEIGFVFHPDYQGRGLAREAAEVVLRLGFADLGLHRVIGRCDSLNVASYRLLERLGMRREAHFVHDEIFKGTWGDQYVYAMLDDEWRQRAGSVQDVDRPRDDQPDRDE